MIPVSRPIISAKSSRYVAAAVRSGWVSSAGPYVEQFEKKFAAYLSVKYAITTTSGTTALHLALVALGIGPGDEVIVPALTMIAPVFAVLYTGATPVLVDSEPETGNLDTLLLEEKITPRTKAILVVHLYGHPAKMSPLMKLARKHKLTVIEDAAEAMGAAYNGKKVGTLGDVGAFSFYANKLITTGEGGMVVTNNKILADKMRTLKDMAHEPTKRFRHSELGYNYRLTNLQAALGLGQLEDVELLFRKKVAIAHKYSTLLKGVKELILPVEEAYATPSYWMYALRVGSQSKLSKDALRHRLYQLKIDTRDFFIPMHQQPVFQKRGLFKNERYPVAENHAQTGFYLPSGPKLSAADQLYVSQALKRSYGYL